MKIVLTVLIICGAYLFNQYMEQKILPNRQADLAIQQIEEDGSREQLRIEQDAQNHWPYVLGGGSVLLIWGVWLRPSKKS